MSKPFQHYSNRGNHLITVFWLQRQKCDASNSATKTRKSKEKIKEELQNSIIRGENFWTKYLNGKVDNVEKCKDMAAVTKEYEDIIRTKKWHHMHCLSARESFSQV